METQSVMLGPTLLKGQLPPNDPSLKDLSTHGTKPVSKLFPCEYLLCWFFSLAYHWSSELFPKHHSKRLSTVLPFINIAYQFRHWDKSSKNFQLLPPLHNQCLKLIVSHRNYYVVMKFWTQKNGCERIGVFKNEVLSII